MPLRTVLLAIDTSTENAGVGVLDGARSFEVRWTSGRTQTTSVLDQIDRCLSLAGLRIDAVDAIAVASGPGAFNGLRVGMSLAKGFALALGKPIVGISTLDVAAAPWVDLDRPVFAVVAAGRGRIVWSRYFPGEAPTRPVNATLDELAALVRQEPSAIVAGEIPRERAAEFGPFCKAGLVTTRNPIVLAELAYDRLQRQEADDLSTLEPIYLHG